MFTSESDRRFNGSSMVLVYLRKCLLVGWESRRANEKKEPTTLK